MADFPVSRLESAETPCYYYDLALLHRTLDAVIAAAGDYHVHYAVKANANPRILAEIASRGLGADCVSGAEVEAAVAAGFNPGSICFAGVGKTDKEITKALSLGIGCFNVESQPELAVIDELAGRMGLVANVAIRVNPNIDAHTHHYITTGLAENKFGISVELLPDVIEMALSLKNVRLLGLHFHIGSQVLDMEPYAALCRKINELQARFPSLTLATINVGGGLGIDYENPDAHPVPDFEAYFSVFRENLHLHPGQQLHFELGRSVVAQCGSLVSRVVYVKKGLKKSFVIVDAGMSELLRPALYGAHHKIENLTAPKSAPEEVYDVVGPICESSDVFATDEKMPLTSRGDIVVFRSAGAYGETMASHYNLRELNQSIFKL